MESALSLHQVQALPAMVSLMTAARALGIGRTKAYELAQADQFPVRLIRVGKSYRVPTADLLRVLEGSGAADASLPADTVT